MDNREAMIAAYNSKYMDKWSDDIYEKDLYALRVDQAEFIQYLKQLNFESGWQAATAHNRDAVIDECVNDVTQILQLISSYYVEKLPTYDARAGLSVICSQYPESLRNKLRSLKTNKEG